MPTAFASFSKSAEVTVALAFPRLRAQPTNYSLIPPPPRQRWSSRLVGTPYPRAEPTNRD